MAEPILATYLIESPLPPAQAAEKLAGIVSAGTFTAVPGETTELRRRFNATVEVCGAAGRSRVAVAALLDRAGHADAPPPGARDDRPAI